MAGKALLKHSNNIRYQSPAMANRRQRYAGLSCCTSERACGTDHNITLPEHFLSSRGVNNTSNAKSEVR